MFSFVNFCKVAVSYSEFWTAVTTKPHQSGLGRTKLFNHAKVTSAVRWSLFIGASAGAAFTQSHAYAQDASESADKKVERIAVTGSRIKRTDMETASPVLAISSEDIARSGLVSVGDVLKEVSTNGAALGLQTNNGNTTGVSRVNLRNCGSNRTLVLVNGRRWVADLNGAVDVSTIPLAAIKSIEVLKDGASSVYGTDAICGVVNVITKNDFDGAEVSAYNGQTSYEDGKRETYSATFGTTGTKSSLLLNVSYTKQEPIMGGDREISSVPIYGLPAEVSASGGRASPTTPWGQFRVNGVSYTRKRDAVGCAPNQVCDAAKTADFKVYDPNTDGYNYAPVNYIQQPSETLSLYAQGSYEIRDNILWKAEVLFNERSSEAQLAAQPLGGLAISADNIYNPFKTNIVGGSFRPLVAPRSYAAEVDTWRFGTSLNGDFDALDRNFSWDVAATYSDNSLVALKNGFFHSGRFTEALGPSRINGSGVAECLTSTGSVIAGCVPFNVFGGPEGVTQAMLNYVTVSPRDLAYSKMWDYSGNISTELFELPAGMVAVNVGTEIRRESGYTSPEPLTVLGQVLGDNAATPTVGGFSLKEMYAEARIPLLSDMPGVQSLEAELSTRYSDYSNFGDVTNNSYKLTYRPTDELMFRASYNEGFRAPSISELYQGKSDSRPSATDPCSTNSNAYKNIPGVKERCAAAGVATDFVQKDPQVRAQVGGNPEIQPESSDSLTFGVVYDPEFIDGLNMTIDWYRMELENSIGSRSAASIMSRCYTQGLSQDCALITRDFTGTLNGNPGEISNITSLGMNFLGGQHVEGVDWNVNYRFETEYGTWGLNWDSAYTIYNGDLGKLKRGELTKDGTISGGNGAGFLSAGASGGGTTFRLKSNLTMSWRKDDFSASLTAQYMSKQIESCSGIVSAATALNKPELRDLCSDPDYKEVAYTFAPGSTDIVATPDTPAPRNELPATVYFDGQVGWDSPWNNSITVGVRNLFDKEPPKAYSAFANTFDPNYRTPGRFYYVSFTQKF